MLHIAFLVCVRLFQRNGCAQVDSSSRDCCHDTQECGGTEGVLCPPGRPGASTGSGLIGAQHLYHSWPPAPWKIPGQPLKLCPSLLQRGSNCSDPTSAISDSIACASTSWLLSTPFLSWFEALWLFLLPHVFSILTASYCFHSGCQSAPDSAIHACLSLWTLHPKASLKTLWCSYSTLSFSWRVWIPGGIFLGLLSR